MKKFMKFLKPAAIVLRVIMAVVLVFSVAHITAVAKRDKQ